MINSSNISDVTINFDILFSVFSKLDPKDLMICALVSKVFCEVSENRILWKQKAKELNIQVASTKEEVLAVVRKTIAACQDLKWLFQYKKNEPFEIYRRIFRFEKECPNLNELEGLQKEEKLENVSPDKLRSFAKDHLRCVQSNLINSKKDNTIKKEILKLLTILNLNHSLFVKNEGRILFEWSLLEAWDRVTKCLTTNTIEKEKGYQLLDLLNRIAFSFDITCTQGLDVGFTFFSTLNIVKTDKLLAQENNRTKILQNGDEILKTYRQINHLKEQCNHTRKGKVGRAKRASLKSQITAHRERVKELYEIKKAKDIIDKYWFQITEIFQYQRSWLKKKLEKLVDEEQVERNIHSNSQDSPHISFQFFNRVLDFFDLSEQNFDLNPNKDVFTLKPLNNIERNDLIDVMLFADQYPKLYKYLVSAIKIQHPEIVFHDVLQLSKDGGEPSRILQLIKKKI